ncbi:transposase [Phyllobacterium myrsinacearum]|uniref:ISL3 family transposase n=1 Tax=Phyllobacterium myrsinacearum TaxID=28101 RepID=UPI001028E1CC|nr:ISL3 family transposase [Phyllobacterium myrsinacearum]RZS76892.1 transposase [Phyllobacterium myrsinacearum]
MDQRFRLSAIVPQGFTVERTSVCAEQITVWIRCDAHNIACPCCGTLSSRLQSRYWRRAADLPLAGRRVDLRIMVRRFRCDAVLCSRQIFAERFGDNVLAPLARRTARLDHIVHHLGLALGGRPAASFANRLMLPVSNDTLLRVVRRRARTPTDPLLIIGIDDFAWRRNHRYGTIVCDLERRRPVVLLPDREQATAEAWLKGHPSISIVARDRGGGYGEAVAKSLPHAMQVADRWHLMVNASRAFLDAVRKSMRDIRTVIGATTINPELLTCAERLQYEGYIRREETNASILALSASGMPIKRIAKQTGYARQTIRRVVRGERSDMFRPRQSALEPHLSWLDAQWADGCRNSAHLWRRLRSQGFQGSARVVAEWATRRRRAEQVNAGSLQRLPSARNIARLMTTGRDALSKADSIVITAIENRLPSLVQAREIIEGFHQMLRRKTAADLTPWIDKARSTLVASFANGVAKDEPAVRAAISSAWSNGQAEGQITKLKLVKRQMYGRAKLDLLQARLIGAI